MYKQFQSTANHFESFLFETSRMLAPGLAQMNISRDFLSEEVARNSKDKNKYDRKRIS
jgi:hypothetical protein